MSRTLEDATHLTTEQKRVLVERLLREKAGGAYVPVDPEYPPARLAFMLEDARVSVLLTERRLVERLPWSEPGRLLCLDAPGEAQEGACASNPSGGATPEDLAYVIYTSG